MKVCVNYRLLPDPLGEQVVEVAPPPGYGRVLTGMARQGDLYLDNRSVLHASDGKREPRWLPVRPEWLTDPVQGCAISFSCLIRPGVRDEPPCERCGHQARNKGERFCVACGRLIVRRGRGRRP